MEIETIPLKHGISCCGFLFREKPKKRVLLPKKCLSYDIPKRDFKLIKSGNDYIMPDGTLISNKELTALFPEVMLIAVIQLIIHLWCLN